MNTQQILRTAETALIVIAVAVVMIRLLLTAYRLRKRDGNPVETAPAVAYYKHPDMKPVLLGRASTYVYYITFHTDIGEQLKLYMDRDDYHSITEGSRGILTWQGEKFWKFQKEVS